METVFADTNNLWLTVYLCYSHIRTHTLTNDNNPLSTMLNKVDSRTVVSNMQQSKKGFDCPLCNKKAFASAEVRLEPDQVRLGTHPIL